MGALGGFREGRSYNRGQAGQRAVSRCWEGGGGGRQTHEGKTEVPLVRVALWPLLCSVVVIEEVPGVSPVVRFHTPSRFVDWLCDLLPLGVVLLAMAIDTVGIAVALLAVDNVLAISVAMAISIGVAVERRALVRRRLARTASSRHHCRSNGVQHGERTTTLSAIEHSQKKIGSVLPRPHELPGQWSFKINFG